MTIHTTDTEQVHAVKSLQSHLIEHHSFYNNTHVGNCFTGLCAKCNGYNNNLVIATQIRGTNGVAETVRTASYLLLYFIIRLCNLWFVPTHADCNNNKDSASDQKYCNNHHYNDDDHCVLSQTFGRDGRRQRSMS